MCFAVQYINNQAKDVLACTTIPLISPQFVVPASSPLSPARFLSQSVPVFEVLGSGYMLRLPRDLQNMFSRYLHFLSSMRPHSLPQRYQTMPMQCRLDRVVPSNNKMCGLNLRYQLQDLQQHGHNMHLMHQQR